MKNLRGSGNQHNEHVISVYWKKTNQRMKIIGHIPDALAKLVHGVMSEWKILQMIDKIDEKHKIAPEGTCMPGGGIGIACIYILYGAKIYKTNL